MKTDAQHKDDVTEELTVPPPASQAQVQTLMEEMFKRQAQAGAVHIRPRHNRGKGPR